MGHSAARAMWWMERRPGRHRHHRHPRNARHVSSSERDQLVLNQLVFLLESACCSRSVEARHMSWRCRRRAHYKLFSISASLPSGSYRFPSLAKNTQTLRLPTAALPRVPGVMLPGASRRSAPARITWDVDYEIDAKYNPKLFERMPTGNAPAVEDTMIRLALLALLPALLAAQENSRRQAEVKVVSVRDRAQQEGAFIRDLGKDDFSVLENGRPQTIRYFSRETDLPLTRPDDRYQLEPEARHGSERIASYTFLEQVCGKERPVFIMQFDLSSILLRS